MLHLKLLKKFIMPCGLCAAVPAIKPSHPSKDCPVDCENKTEPEKLVRPSELPVYSLEDICSKQTSWDSKKNYEPSSLEEAISQARKSVQGLVKEYKYLMLNFNTKFETGKEHSKFLLEYLREESNLLPRVGAITIGGLTGLILSLRGGKFKRLVYTSGGLLGTAAICYPKDAAKSLCMARQYAYIGYNFAYGVKPGDERAKMPELKLPTSLSEFVDLTVSSGSTLIETISNKVRQTVDQTKEQKPTSKSSTDEK